MGRLRRGVLGLAATGYGALVVWACGTDYDAAQGSADASDESTLDGTTGPLDPRCRQATSRCLAIPPSWSGPYVLTDAACSGDKPNTVVEKIAFDAAPVDCGCSCTVPAKCAYRSSIAVGGTCQTPPNDPHAGGCGGGSGGGSSYSFFVTVDRDASASCQVAKTEDHGNVPDAANVRVCSAASSPEREDCGASEVCATAGSCVMAIGDLPCPAGFGRRTVVYDSVDDKRTCTGACGCTTTTKPNCTSPSVRFAPGAAVVIPDTCDPSAFDAAPVPMDTCVTITSNSYVYGFFGDASPGACTTTYDGGPAGEVVPTGPTTVCCEE